MALNENAGNMPGVDTEYSGVRRRQYSSCDQCRRSKRACNVVVSNTIPVTTTSPCAYCIKTKKVCSVEWIGSVRRGSSSGKSRNAKELRKRRQRSNSRETQNNATTPSSVDLTPGKTASSSASIIKDRDYEGVTGDFNSGENPSDVLVFPSFNGIDDIVCPDFGASLSSCQCETESIYTDESCAEKESTISTVSKGSMTPFTSRHDSTALMNQRLASSTNQSFISSSLIKIYHDTMENALSCWLTDRNCPYETSNGMMEGAQSEKEAMYGIWGQNWSNRILQRVCRLDRTAETIRDRPLILSEERAVSKALKMAIMAFSSQWIQTGKRNGAYLPTFFGIRTTEKDFSGEWAASSFGRNMQETFWHEARRALLEVSHIESFRVVFANVLFSITQAPQDIETYLKRLSLKRPHSTDLPKELGVILASEGPPVFLEAAARQVYSFRCKLENHKILSSLKGGDKNKDPLDAQDRKTFNFLFWLAVMFDTLMAAMTQRPPVVSDEDSEISLVPSKLAVPVTINLVQNLERPDSGVKSDESLGIWKRYFLRPRRSVTWPCSYEEAASVLTDAAPVKVLLFRKVTKLQLLLSRSTPKESIEFAIADAMNTYQFWSENYEPFFQQCVMHHDDLPARIQSWYVVLVGHWYLGTLLLADQIEIADENHRGNEDNSYKREFSQLVGKLRFQNAGSLADIAKCSCPRYNSSFEKSSNFHFVINKGAILTEPWTSVLIRSFAKGGLVSLEQISNIRGDIDRKLRTQCEYCIEALWHLGKKSDMSLLAFFSLLTVYYDKTGSYGQFDANVAENMVTDQDMLMDEDFFCNMDSGMDTQGLYSF